MSWRIDEYIANVGELMWVDSHLGPQPFPRAHTLPREALAQMPIQVTGSHGASSLRNGSWSSSRERSVRAGVKWRQRTPSPRAVAPRLFPRWNASPALPGLLNF